MYNVYLTSLFNFIQCADEELRSQILTLQTALVEAREENAARIEHETKLTSQFQVHWACGASLCTVCMCVHAY